MLPPSRIEFDSSALRQTKTTVLELPDIINYNCRRRKTFQFRYLHASRQPVRIGCSSSLNLTATETSDTDSGLLARKLFPSKTWEHTENGFARENHNCSHPPNFNFPPLHPHLERQSEGMKWNSRGSQEASSSSSNSRARFANLTYIDRQRFRCRRAFPEYPTDRGSGENLLKFNITLSLPLNGYLVMA